MTTLTAVAAGGNWSSASTWSPAQVPTAADNCKITGTMTGTVTVNGTTGSPNLCRSLDCTGATHTLNHTGVLNVGDGSGGLFKLVAGMTYNAGGTLNFVSTTTGNNITSAGKAMPVIEFNGAGGSWTLQDNLTFSSNAGITLTAGTLNAGAKTLSSLGYFFSNNSNTRALTMSGNWTINGGGGTVWDITISTGLTLTATSSNITFTGYPMVFQGGGLTYASVTLGGTAGFSPVVYGSNTFVNLTYAGAGPDSLIFGANQTVTGTLTISGDSTQRILVQSDIVGTSRTLTTATNSISYADFQDITGAGTSGWNLSSITGGSGDCCGNSGITFSTPINCYMVTAVSANWSGSNWYTTSGGSTHTRLPLPQDTAIFDANSVNASSLEIHIDVPRVGGMDWTGVMNDPDLGLNNDVSFFGDTIFVSAMGVGGFGSGTVTFENRGPINLDLDGGDWSLGYLVQDGPGGTINQTGDFGYTPAVFYLTSGTWSNGSYAFTAEQAVTIDGGTLNVGSGLVTGETTLTLSAGTIEMNGNPISLTWGGTALTISGGVLNLSGQINNSGSISVSGGTINDTGPAGELVTGDVTFTGGNSTIRKLTLGGSYSQSSTSSVTITGSATWGGDWTMSGTDFYFTTAEIPVWSAGTLALYGGISWTFGG